LVVGRLYSRIELKRRFRITDASIRNGIFKLGAYDSVWLFVTENKSPDQTQYRDRLRGDDLYMDGQTAGRTDYLIIDKSLGYEILLFHRKHKRQYRNYAFRYQGRFRYVDYKRNAPKHFHLRRLDKPAWKTTLATLESVTGSAQPGARSSLRRLKSRIIKTRSDLSRKQIKARLRNNLPTNEASDQLNERTQAHQELVMKLYSLYEDAGLECKDTPFDLLVLGKRLCLLHEMKTIRKYDLADERKRIREAVGQLAYYEYFDVVYQIPLGSRLLKLVVLQHEPAPEHIMFLRKNRIGTIWIDRHGKIQGDVATLKIVRKLTS
jgi:hypothetical protein